MTPLEAQKRAEELWPGQSPIVVTTIEDEWFIETIDRPHILNAAGEPVCHDECIAKGKEHA